MLKYMFSCIFLLVLCKNNIVTSCRSSAPPPPAPKPEPKRISYWILAPGLTDNGPVNFDGNIRSVTVDWYQTTFIDSEGRPIIGYKIKLWEDEKIKLFRFENVDNTTKLIEEFKYIYKCDHTRDEKLFIHSYEWFKPETEPRVLIAGWDDKSATFGGFKTDVRYHIAVESYNILLEGYHYSQPTVVTIPNDRNITKFPRRIVEQNTFPNKGWFSTNQWWFNYPNSVH